jgi:Cu(I)/Ag(I) efflux system membrane protein CusA/SilA
VPGVAEVASIGGMVKQYQVVLDPNRLPPTASPSSSAVEAIQRANQEPAAR